MKKLFAFVFSFAAAISVFAVTPVPYTEVVTCNLRVQGNGSVGMYIHDESGTSPLTWTWTSSAPIESTPVSAIFRPGKKYSITYGGNGTTYSSWLSFIAPEGYQVYVDHVPTNMMPIGVQTGSYNRTLTIELRPVVQNASPMPLGNFSGVQLGKSVSWQVGLGTLFGGRNAGRLYFKEYDLSGSPATRSKLYVAVANSTSEVWTINDGPSNQTLRQVITPMGVIDLLDVPNDGYWIRFFPHSQSEGSPGNPNILYGSPWKTIRVQSPAANQLKITETEGSAVRVSLLTLSSGSVPSGNYGWTLQEGDGTTWLRTTTHSSTSTNTGVVASGGTVTSVGGNTIHKFTGSGTFTVTNAPAGNSVEYLVVGGGGGGGGATGGGGGAGGFRTGSLTVAAQGYSVTVGGGGAGGQGFAVGGNGGASTFNGITSQGGGGGGFNGVSGLSGGSGGGAGHASGVGGNGTSGQGNNGGNGGWDPRYPGGGGGGAGGAGGTASNNNGGIGGAGAASSITGSSVMYAGGGGGGIYNAGWTAAGGAGGGGTGGSNNTSPTPGAANTGGGGGGSGHNGPAGASGGSGIVVLRYPIGTIYREVVETVRTGSTGGTVVAKTKYRYENIGGGGEELTQVIADPDSAALTTTYTYHTNSANLGNFRRVRSVTGPTGSWSAQEYYDDWERRGQLKYQYQPHLDSPATATLDPAQGRSVYYEYTADWAGRYSRPTLRQEKTNNIVTAKTTWSHGDITPPSDWPREYAYEYSYGDATNYQTTYSERFRADSWPTIVGVTTVSKGADQTQTSWGRVTGYYNPANGTFTQIGQSISHVREIVVHGSTSSSGANAVSSWDGHSFSTVYLVPNKSTMDAVISASQGPVLRKEKWVYTGSGFALLSWENYTYNDQVRLTSQVSSNGATVTNTYTNGLLTSTVGVDGTETQFTYDLLWRTATSVKKGAMPAPAVLTSGYSYWPQGDITTTNTYDGANRVTQQVVSGPPLFLTSSAVFDLAGRTTSQTAPGGYVTSFGYSAGGKIVTATLSGGATKITETHLDGRTKSVTGTSVVNEFYTYNLNSDGRREIIRRQVSTSGPIMDYTYSDWLGRNTIHQVPSPSGSGYTDHRWYYNSNGQLWKETRTGSADTLYQYDTLGRMFRSGLDVNANGSLDLASSDRVNETNAYYYLESGVSWWARNQTYVYPTDGSATAIKVSDVLNQLSGFSSGRLSQTNAYDVYWNRTITTVDVDRFAKRVITTTDTPDSNVNAVSVAYNGLAVEARDAVGVTMRYEYDGLGRQYKSIHPRTGATTTAFMNGTSQVWTVTDPANIVQSRYTYDSAGRIASVENAAMPSGMTIYEYNSRGQKTRESGNATYPVDYTYDSQGRQATMKTYRSGSPDTTTWNYHPATGLVTSKVDANNRSTSYTYTQAGQIATRTWARGVVTTYGYSSTTGELTSVSYSDGTPGITYSYNRLGKQATVNDYAGLRTFTYNLGGTLELQSEQLGSYYGDRRLNYYYDIAGNGTKGRLTLFTLTNYGGTTQHYQDFAYQADGRVNYTGAYAVGYSGVGFNYGYQANSHLVNQVLQSSSGYSDTRTYDPYHDWVDARATTVSSTTKASFGYTQDNMGRVTQIGKTGEMFNRYGNGTQGLWTNYGYNFRSELTSDQTKLAGTSTVLTGRDDTYMYDEIGNRTSFTHNGSSRFYSTNAVNQYVGINSGPGVFDVAGAAISPTVTVSQSGGSTLTATRHGQYFFSGYPAGGPMASYATLTVSAPQDTPSSFALSVFHPGGESPQYDYDGNLTSDNRWLYTYDAENRLIWQETSMPAIMAGVPKTALAYRYDYLGRRVHKVNYSWNGSAWIYQSEDRFAYNGWNLLARGDGFFNISKNFFWGLDITGTMTGAGGVGGLLMVQEGGNTYLPAYDGNGNIHAMIKASDGSIAAAYEYDAFGNTLRESGPYAASNPFRFSTKYTDTETSLVYYGLRYYSPSLGRFINRDPIEEQGGLNLYGFVRNNAVNAWDYLGMEIQYFYFSGAPDSSWTKQAGLNGTTDWVDANGNIHRKTLLPQPGINDGVINDIPGYIDDTYLNDYSSGSYVDSLNSQVAGMVAENQAVWDNIESNPAAAARNSGSGGPSLINRVIDAITGRDVPKGTVTLAPLSFTHEETLTQLPPMPEVTKSSLPDLDYGAYAMGYDNQRRYADQRVAEATAWNNAARETFDNPVFQQPITTLATAGGQQVVSVAGTFVGGPVALQGVVAAGRGIVGAANIVRAGAPIIASDVAGMTALGRVALIETQAMIVARAPFLLPATAAVVNNQVANPMGSRPSLPSEILRQFNDLFK